MNVITRDNKDKWTEQKISMDIPNFLQNLTQEEIEEHNKRVDEYEKKMELEKRLKIFRNCGIGENYWNYDLHNFKTTLPMQKTMLNSARNFFGKVRNGQKTNLVLLGEAGQGKSMIAIGLLKEFCFTVKEVKFGLNQYYTILYITSKELCDMLARTQSYSYSKSLDSVLNDLAKPDIVVIDEVRKATVKNEFECLFSFFDKRMQYKKSSILCGNMTQDEFNSNMSSYGMSRLNIDGNLILVNVEGIPDLRQNNTEIK